MFILVQNKGVKVTAAAAAVVVIHTHIHIHKSLLDKYILLQYTDLTQNTNTLTPILPLASYNGLSLVNSLYMDIL